MGWFYRSTMVKLPSHTLGILQMSDELYLPLPRVMRHTCLLNKRNQWILLGWRSRLSWNSRHALCLSTVTGKFITVLSEVGSKSQDPELGDAGQSSRRTVCDERRGKP